MGAGTGFTYSRSNSQTPKNIGNIIQSPGPLSIPVDIMVCIYLKYFIY